MELATTSSGPTIDAEALTADRRSIHIRPLRTDDQLALPDFDNRASDHSRYLRHFAQSRRSADVYVAQLRGSVGSDHLAVGAVVDGAIVAVASFDRIAQARQRGITRFVADVLAQNVAMVNLVRALGLRTMVEADGDGHGDGRTAVDRWRRRRGMRQR